MGIAFNRAIGRYCPIHEGIATVLTESRLVRLATATGAPLKSYSFQSFTLLTITTQIVKPKKELIEYVALKMNSKRR
jgi:S-adenosylhomocysteine hydrolase